MCRPDVIGLNHYLTSDRFVDDRLERYPEAVLGGNGREPYADVTANRVAGRPSAGFAGALRDAWHRYQAPVAVTEVHNGSTRDEQLRWLDEAWGAACEALDGGVDVRVVNVWALFGAYDWDSLLTRRRCRYEVGAFDVTRARRRPTIPSSCWMHPTGGGAPTGCCFPPSGENTIGPRVLAEACAERRLPLLTFSSDLVFDGRKASPYIEPDAPGPLSVYGRSRRRPRRRCPVRCRRPW